MVAKSKFSETIFLLQILPKYDILDLKIVTSSHFRIWAIFGPMLDLSRFWTKLRVQTGHLQQLNKEDHQSFGISIIELIGRLKSIKVKPHLTGCVPEFQIDIPI